MEVIGYGSFEEMWEDLEASMKAADARTQDWQKEIKVGDWFTTQFEDLLILNHVLEMVKGEGLENYRYCRSYSLAVMDGEHGDVHVSSAIIPICGSCAKNIAKYLLGFEIKN